MSLARRALAAVFALPPVALVVIAIVSVQAGASLGAALVRTHSSFTVVALRLLITAIVLWIARRPSGRGATPGALRRAILLGLVIGAMNSSFYAALGRLPLGVAVTIEFSGPLAVAILGSRRLLDLLWVAMAAAGIWILAGGRFVADDALGVALAFVAGGCWALYIVLGTRVSHDWPEARGLAISTAVAAAIVTPLGIAAGGLGDIVASPWLLVLGAGVAIFASVVPWSLELVAMGRVPSRTFGILMSLEPAVAAVMGAILLAEGLPLTEVLAIGLVIAASIGATREARRGRSGEAEPQLPGELEV